MLASGGAGYNVEPIRELRSAETGSRCLVARRCTRVTELTLIPDPSADLKSGFFRMLVTSGKYGMSSSEVGSGSELPTTCSTCPSQHKRTYHTLQTAVSAVHAWYLVDLEWTGWSIMTHYTTVLYCADCRIPDSWADDVGYGTKMLLILHRTMVWSGPVVTWCRSGRTNHRKSLCSCVFRKAVSSVQYSTLLYTGCHCVWALFYRHKNLYSTVLVCHACAQSAINTTGEEG